jgi:hypothetical protein
MYILQVECVLNMGYIEIKDKLTNKMIKKMGVCVEK